MGSVPTTIPSINADGFAARIAALIPRGWANDAAKQPGGNLYSLLKSIGSQLSFELEAVAYALGSTRIQTAVAPELDLASKDFLGDMLPRPKGMTDADYSTLILANLLPAGATRTAMSNALTKLTGVKPRIIEPWNPGDTGAFDIGISYLDVNTRANPCCLADTGARYQAFILTPLPPFTGLGSNPLNTLDDGAFMDENAYDVQLQPSNISDLYNLINRIRPYGTIVWVQIVSSQSISFLLLEGGGQLELEGGGGFFELEGSGLGL